MLCFQQCSIFEICYCGKKGPASFDNSDLVVDVKCASFGCMCFLLKILCSSSFATSFFLTATVRNNELKALCFSVLTLIVKDSIHGKEKLVEAGGLKQIIRYMDRGPDVTIAAITLLSELVKSKNILEQLGQECGAILMLVTVSVRGNHPELATDIESILDQLSYDGDSYHEENIKAMVKANWCKPFADCLHKGSQGSKLAMVKWLACFELDDNRREALVQQNVIDALVDMLKSKQFRLESPALEALRKFSFHEKSKKCIAKAGGVPLLLELLKKSQLEMKKNATAILADLTMKHGASFLLYEDETPIEPQMYMWDIYLLPWKKNL